MFSLLLLVEKFVDSSKIMTDFRRELYGGVQKKILFWCILAYFNTPPENRLMGIATFSLCGFGFDGSLFILKLCL